MSGIINKVKDALHHDKSSSTTHSGTAEGVAGPHGSRAANAADPRVDSDLDGSRHTGATTHGTHGTTGGLTGTHGTHTTGTTSTGYGASNTTAGPHSSNMANKVDPRVDSDLDGSRNMGAHSGTTGGYSSGTSGLTGTSHGTSGLTGSNHGSSGLTGTNHGTTGIGNSSAHTSSTTPHNSNLLNKVDPRVDSTTSGAYSGTHAGNTHTTGTHSGTGAFSGTGTHGGLSNSSNAGPHNSAMANKADPRVDSDLDGRGNRHGASHGGILGASGSHATAGSGTAQNTAGPHNSDMLNKIDPRVDSDRDGSKTYGGNQTHA